MTTTSDPTTQRDPSAELSAIVEEEIRILQELGTTLLEENAAIAARDIDALREQGIDKLGALEAIAALEERRRQLWSADESAVASRFEEVRRLTSRCREQNSANDALLRTERRFVDGLLNILRGGASGTDVYAGDASISRGSSGRRIPLANA